MQGKAHLGAFDGPAPVNVPMKCDGKARASRNLTMNKEGQGRLYVSIGMKYAPTESNAGAGRLWVLTVERGIRGCDGREVTSQPAS